MAVKNTRSHFSTAPVITGITHKDGFYHIAWTFTDRAPVRGFVIYYSRRRKAADDGKAVTENVHQYALDEDLLKEKGAWFISLTAFDALGKESAHSRAAVIFR